MSDLVEIQWTIRDSGIMTFEKPEGWDEMDEDDRESLAYEMVEEEIAERLDNNWLSFDVIIEEVND